jgi:TonB family protein
MLANQSIRNCALTLLLSLTLCHLLSGCREEREMSAEDREKEARSRDQKREREKSERAAHQIEIRRYVKDLQEHIKSKFHPTIASAQFGIISFEIDGNGRPNRVKIVKGVNPEINRAMILAVEAARPLPKPPAFMDDPVSIYFSFDPRVLHSSSRFDDKDRIKETIKASTVKLQENPQDKEALASRGRACLAMNDLLSVKQAAKDLSLLCSLEPGEIKYLTLAVRAARRLGDDKSFLELSEQAFQAEPDLENTLNYIEALTYSGKYQEALSACSAALKKFPNDPDLGCMTAYVYLHYDKPLDCLSQCERVLKIEPDQAMAYAYKGDAYTTLQNYKEAMQAYDLSISLNEDDEFNYLRRARLNNLLGKFDKAIKDATAALTIDPECGQAFYYRAFANAALGLNGQAQKDKSRAASLGYLLSTDSK